MIIGREQMVGREGGECNEDTIYEGLKELVKIFLNKGTHF